MGKIIKGKWNMPVSENTQKQRSQESMDINVLEKFFHSKVYPEVRNMLKVYERSNLKGLEVLQPQSITFREAIIIGFFTSLLTGVVVYYLLRRK